MRLQKTILAVAATLALAAPAAAFAQDWGSQSRDGGRYEQTQDRRGYDQDHRSDRNDRYGGRGYDRHQVCRRGVFYMRGTWCATRGRVSNDRYDRYGRRDEQRGGYWDRRN